MNGLAWLWMKKRQNLAAEVYPEAMGDFAAQRYYDARQAAKVPIFLNMDFWGGHHLLNRLIEVSFLKFWLNLRANRYQERPLGRFFHFYFNFFKRRKLLNTILISVSCSVYMPLV